MRKAVCIGDLGSIITGKTPPTTNKNYYGDKYLFIKPTDISETSKYTYETEEMSFVDSECPASEIECFPN